MQRNVLSLVGVGLAGFFSGWFLMGWLIWPVAYVGEAYTYELNQADKLRYTSAVVDSYAATGIADPAWFAQWTPEEFNQALEQVAQANPAKANWARALANQMSVSMAQPVQVKAQNQASQTIPTDSLYLLWLILIVIVVCAVVLGVVFGIQAIWHGRVIKPQSSITGFDQAFVSRTTEEYIPVKATPTSKLALMSTHLTFGSNHPTDQHLPIERDGIAMGEFGVSQVEDLQAWDVWLFDPKALGTVTKVLSDERGTALDGRGEFIAWKEPFTLETPNLKMTGIAVKQLEGGLQVELTVEGKDAE